MFGELCTDHAPALFKPIPQMSLISIRYRLQALIRDHPIWGMGST